LDFSRLRQGEIIAGVAGLALIIFMFLPWYSLGIDPPEIDIPDIPGIDTSGIQPPEVDDDASGWDSLTDFDGFLIAAAGLAGIILAGLAAAGRKVNLGGLPRGSVTAFLGVLATALIFWRLFAQPTPGADLEIGIFLGLAAAIGVAVGALMSLREGGFEPVVAHGPAPRKASSSGTARRASSASRAKPAGGAKKPAAKAKPRASGTRKRSTGAKK
jgi:hypothetical protein